MNDAPNATDEPGIPYDENRPEAPGQGSPLSKDARQWAMICHLVALSGLLANGIGFLLGPLVVWLVKRVDDPFIDEQGKEAVNFQLTMFLVGFLCIPFVIVLIGIPMLIVVFLLMIIFPVIAAIQAGEGVHYRYPLSIRFIK